MQVAKLLAETRSASVGVVDQKEMQVHITLLSHVANEASQPQRIATNLPMHFLELF